MTSNHGIFQQILTAVIVGCLLGCILGSIVLAVFAIPPLVIAGLPKAYTPTSTETRVATITLAPSRTGTNTRSPATQAVPQTSAPAVTPISSTAGTRVPTSTRTPLPTKTPYPVVQHFLIGRPLIPPAGRVIPNWTYLYGTTRKGDLPVHHGEDFDENPVGTPLFAVADGTIVVAGGDEQPVCGDQGKTLCGPFTQPGGFYGNLVVIQLAQGYEGKLVYALYGHMSKVTAEKGPIKAGAPVGEVGGSGVADGGSHLHLEIRLGINDYAHTRNPILWTTPIAGRGSLIGRYVDSKGTPIRGALVNILRADGTFVAGTETYSRDRYAAVNSDDEIGENFAVGDLPVGEYIVRINGQSYAQHVIVEEGKLSFVELGGAP